MAANTNQIIYSDFADSFQNHPVTGDVAMVIGSQSVIQSVTNLVQMNHYDIPFHPEIGGNVRKLLFELADPTTAGLISQEITDVINNFEPRAQLTNVDVVWDEVNNGFDVTVIFTVLGSTSPLSISFFLERIR